MLDLSLVQKISIWVVPVILGITVHEVAHGFIARKLGDNTACTFLHGIFFYQP